MKSTLLLLFSVVTLLASGQDTTFFVCTNVLKITCPVVEFGCPPYAEDVSKIDTYKISIPAITSLQAGQYIVFKANAKNTGEAKLNLNNTGGKLIVKDVNTPLVTGDILSGEICLVIYDGIKWILK